MTQGLGCLIDSAENGAEAADLAASKPYDLILMDCQMPVTDGYEATALIRKGGGQSANAPIVALTANAMAGDREKCLDAGMDDYMAKPIRPEDLKAMVERWGGVRR